MPLGTIYLIRSKHHKKFINKQRTLQRIILLKKNLVEDESLVILDVLNATVGFVRSLAGFLSRLVTLLSSLCLITFSASIKSSTNGKKY